MKVNIVCAMDEKRGIGKDNKVPWHIKEDLIKLKNLTKDHVVILGRKTYDSMVGYYDKTGRPMPGRIYMVVTRDKKYKPTRENSKTVHSLEEALEIAGSVIATPSEARGKQSQAEGIASSPVSRRAPRNDKSKEEVFVIGGGQIFQQVMPLADKLYLTIVEGDFDCDTFFPDYSEFKKIVSEESRESEGYKYKFLELER